MKRTICFILILVLLSYTTTAINFERLSDSKGFNKATTKCKTNSDCYITSSTCCSCSSGGIQVAVNELGLAYYDWWKCNYCSNQIRCKMVYNCIAEETRCINKTCRLWISIQYDTII